MTTTGAEKKLRWQTRFYQRMPVRRCVTTHQNSSCVAGRQTIKAGSRIYDERRRQIWCVYERRIACARRLQLIQCYGFIADGWRETLFF